VKFALARTGMKDAKTVEKKSAQIIYGLEKKIAQKRRG
jgi:hypothetical protein